MKHATREELDAALDTIRQSPRDLGVLELIVRRPLTGEREVVEHGALDLAQGLVGDNWRTRTTSRTPDGALHPETQLTIMNARVIAALTKDQSSWSLAGDQLYIDMALGDDNLPPGTRVGIGSSVLQVTTQPHTGCKKFTERFGVDAAKWINSPVGKQLHLRGIYVKVIQQGRVQVGDTVART